MAAGIRPTASLAGNRMHYGNSGRGSQSLREESDVDRRHFLPIASFAGNRMHSGTPHWQWTWITEHAADRTLDRPTPALLGTTLAADVSRRTCGQQQARLATARTAGHHTGSGRKS